MKYTIDLPKEVVERLEAYADEQRQTPEEAITELLSRDLLRSAPAPDNGDSVPVGVNPLAEFFGRYTADVPDITRRHDYYLAEEAEGKHDDAE